MMAKRNTCGTLFGKASSCSLAGILTLTGGLSLLLVLLLFSYLLLPSSFLSFCVTSDPHLIFAWHLPRLRLPTLMDPDTADTPIPHIGFFSNDSQKDTGRTTA
jgi:hypothetical protein